MMLKMRLVALVTISPLLILGCYSSLLGPTGGGHFRPTQVGEPIQLIRGYIEAPGTPWKIRLDPLKVRGGATNITYIINQLSIGSFPPFPFRIFAFFTAGIGPLYPDQTSPNLAGEVIFLYSMVVEPSLLSQFKSGHLDAKWLNMVKASGQLDLYMVYGMKQSRALNIRDISGDYQDKLKFWPGFIAAFAYTADGKDYRVIHAFTYTVGTLPNTAVFHDFSYIQMDVPSTPQNRFDDFVAMLKSTRFGEQNLINRPPTRTIGQRDLTLKAPLNQVPSPQPNLQAAKIKLTEIVDERQDKSRIGFRNDVFGSMGDVLLEQDVSDTMLMALKENFRTAGDQLVDSGEDFIVEGHLRKFWVYADPTIFYWNMIGDIELSLFISPVNQAQESIQKNYECHQIDITFIWPSASLMDKVLDECVSELMMKVRIDPVWKQARSSKQTP
jgi:hypothetical protein